MKKIATSKLLLAASVLLGAPSAAYGAVVYDAITVYDGTGSVLASISATPAELAADPFAIFYVPGIPVDQTLFGSYGIVIDGGVAVDIFGIANGGPDGYNLAFSPGGQAQAYPVQNPVFATGLPIDLTKYLDPSLQSLGDTAVFTASGAITIPGAPEPMGWAVMVLGVGMIGAGLRHKRRVSVRYAFA